MATETVEVLIQGGKATAAPPLGPALGPLGVNIGEVVGAINEKTKSFAGMQVPVKVIVDKDDKTFTIEIGTPPAASLIRKEAGIKKASGRPQENFVADLAIEQIIKIALMKADALLGANLKSKVKEIMGTCDSMGVRVEGLLGREAVKATNDGKFDDEITNERTEVAADKAAKIEEEKKRLTAEIEKRRAEYENKAKGILKELSGKDAKVIKAKMREQKIPDEIINALVVEEGEKKAA